MAMMPSIFAAQVMHKRLAPKINAFSYGVYYLAVPLSRLSELADGWRFGVNSAGVLSFHAADHGARDGTDLTQWARQVLVDFPMVRADGEITLVCMPRVLGYVFNPVSFWLCHDVAGQLRAVICEVNNTFGETHSYICCHEDGRVIGPDDWLQAEKRFHVSPFLKREGHYAFRFSHQGARLGIWIDYHNADGQKHLLTALTGALQPYSAAARRRVFWSHPLVTLKAIWLIHWQALRLFAKGVRYVPKPVQQVVKRSGSGKVNKM
jgi:uncharacterized protein